MWFVLPAVIHWHFCQKNAKARLLKLKKHNGIVSTVGTMSLFQTELAHGMTKMTNLSTQHMTDEQRKISKVIPYTLPLDSYNCYSCFACAVADFGNERLQWHVNTK